jgi:hypothetical protein
MFSTATISQRRKKDAKSARLSMGVEGRLTTHLGRPPHL